MSAPPHPDSETQPIRRGPPRRRFGPVRWAFALFLGVGAAGATLPDLVGLDAYSPFAQLIAFRPLGVAALTVLVLVALVVTAFARRFWPVPVVLALIALVGASLVLPRTTASATPPSGGSTLKVLALNVYEGEADAGSLAALIDDEDPDIVSIPEAGGRYKQQLEPLLEPMGYRLESSVSPRRADVTGNTVAIAERLGDVRTRAGDDVRFPYMEATGGGLGELRFVAFHSVAPVPRSVGQWRSDLGTVGQWCSGDTPAVIAGDFNATLDHSVFREATAGCGDAAAQTGNGLSGTWPTWAPAWLGPQIDHVLSTGGITAESFSTHVVPGTDHRAVVTTLRLP
ncbi:Integral membrane protein [Pseudonocardia sp. Ae168_Ps1]|uniref:endonuclease/exonuclease/phosphatase family protein n=1 Tax=unclassified Pseudonocardia TaxID=2619320 RepID=UPI00094ABA0F|nr:MULTISPECIES: endonuclease/exonuclease/phosphatase family protein [unclassified Pseudonocardia]OLL75236.1 Integral membrane protein [Pseudonocardia sp. Ae150A_Ps1]OLL81230.1 Integral membrane protein [Pseudonocardia sp. Ae168_Ps1]OLL95327.1 Integral membrane protein [Pseudonocardia sp. Ae356_Ps1]